MRYLTKDSQHLRFEPAGARTFRTGRVRRQQSVKNQCPSERGMGVHGGRGIRKNGCNVAQARSQAIEQPLFE